MRDVFISYVRENEGEVLRIYNALIKSNISCWLDKEDLQPGEYWPTSISEAIQSGTCFLAIFSKESESKTRSHMREEVYIAIESGKLLPVNQTWIIPVRLSECNIPALDLGGGRTLNKLQYVDMHNNWKIGIDKLIGCISNKLLANGSSSGNNCVNTNKIPIGAMQLNEILKHKQRLDILSKLTGGLSHDLKNLLTVSTGYCHLIAESSTDNKIKDLANNILAANNRASDLAKSLLEFSRPEIKINESIVINKGNL